MTQTNSSNLLQRPFLSRDQTTSIEPAEGLFLESANIIKQKKVFQKINQFADRTNDGGALLTLILLQPKQRKHVPNDRISTDLFHYLNSIAMVLIKFVGYFPQRRNTLENIRPLKEEDNSPHLETIQWIESVTGLSQDRIGRLIDVSRQAINVWKRGGRIANDNRQRLLAVREVLERALSNHPTQDRLIAWLDTPRGADGRTPAQLLEANEIDRARLLAIVTPSPRLVRAQDWAKQPIPEAFLMGEEHYQEALPPEQNDEFNTLNDSVDDDEIIILDNDDLEDSPN